MYIFPPAPEHKGDLLSTLYLLVAHKTVMCVWAEFGNHLCFIPSPAHKWHMISQSRPSDCFGIRFFQHPVPMITNTAAVFSCPGEVEQSTSTEWSLALWALACAMLSASELRLSLSSATIENFGRGRNWCGLHSPRRCRRESWACQEHLSIWKLGTWRGDGNVPYCQLWHFRTLWVYFYFCLLSLRLMSLPISFNMTFTSMHNTQKMVVVICSDIEQG